MQKYQIYSEYFVNLVIVCRDWECA